MNWVTRSGTFWAGEFGNSSRRGDAASELLHEYGLGEKYLLLKSWAFGVIIGIGALAAVGQVTDDAVLCWPLVSVCDVLGSPQSFNGALVRLRGIGMGSDEDSFMSASPECKVIFRTGEYVWPNLVAITTPTSRSRVHIAPFVYDVKSEEATVSRYNALRKDYPDKCLVVTYAGLFETRTDWSRSKAVYPDGSSRYLGFGDQNAAPAQLLAKRAVGVEVDSACLVSNK